MSGFVGYFGFGSLVNRDTLRTRYHASLRARLTGWQRHWQGRQNIGEVDVALLSIHPAPAMAIDGMLVIDALANLPLVDEREIGYDRVALSPTDIQINQADLDRRSVDLPDQLYVYVGKPANDPQSRAPLLQSYTDAVLQGYHREFGDEGVDGFINSTKGFGRGLIEDRLTPQYPRAVALEPGQADLFDRKLLQAGVSFGNNEAAGAL